MEPIRWQHEEDKKKTEEVEGQKTGQSKGLLPIISDANRRHSVEVRKGTATPTQTKGEDDIDPPLEIKY